MSTDYLPRTDSGLRDWAANFSSLAGGSPASYGLTAAQMTAFATANTNYDTALTMATDPSTRTKVTVSGKNDARDVLRQIARELVAIVQAHPGITDPQLLELGLTVRKTQPTRRQRPTDAPEMDVEAVKGRTVVVRLHGGTLDRAKPEGVTGATLFMHVGATPPAEPSDWTFLGNTGRTTTTVPVPGDAATAVWLVAFWYNAAGSGPACTPRSVNVAAAISEPVAALKLAA